MMRWSLMSNAARIVTVAGFGLLATQAVLLILGRYSGLLSLAILGLIVANYLLFRRDRANHAARAADVAEDESPVAEPSK